MSSRIPVPSALIRITAGLALVLAVGACGSQARQSDHSAPATTPSTIASDASENGPASVARASARLEVFARPGDARPRTVLEARTEFGSPRALLVGQQRDGWLEVSLPVRPNGATGWIRSEDVELRSVDEEVVVDLAARTLVLSVKGQEMVRARVAVGTSDAPTPKGRFYVVDKLDTGSAQSAYGPFALGLSGHSDALTEFAGGDGRIGIHGTNDPSSIGRAASHGCVRVPNDVIVSLSELLPLGTPVTIL